MQVVLFPFDIETLWLVFSGAKDSPNHAPADYMMLRKWAWIFFSFFLFFGLLAEASELATNDETCVYQIIDPGWTLLHRFW